MCELLWSDPQPEEGRAASKRGVGVSFGADVTKTFLKANNLDLLVRSHEVSPAHHHTRNTVITVFAVVWHTFGHLNHHFLLHSAWAG